MSEQVPRARARAWSLASLDRGEVYRLRFDPDSRRWEVAVEGRDRAPLAVPGPGQRDDGPVPAAEPRPGTASAAAVPGRGRHRA